MKKITEKTKEYLKSSAKNFVESFKNLDKRILYIVFFKLAFYIVSITSAFILRNILIEKSAKFIGIDPTLMQGGPSAELVALSSSVKHFYYEVVIYAIILGLIIAAMYTLTNLFIWAFITEKKKLKKPFIKKFFVLNMLWVIGWFLLSIFIFSGLKPEVFLKWAVGIVLIYSHLTAIMYIAYFTKGNAVKSLRKAFDIGITKIHYFIIPYIFAGILFLLLNTAISPFQNFAFTNLGPNSATIVGVVIYMFYGAWLRIYLYSFVKRFI